MPDPPLPTDIFLNQAALNIDFQAYVLNILYPDQMAAWTAYQAALSAHTWHDGDPIPVNPYQYVRVSWPTEGAPAFAITDDIVFIRVVEVDGEYNRQRNVENEAYTTDRCNQVTTFTRIIEISLILYGPASYDNACKVQDQTFYQGNHDFLAQRNLYYVPRETFPRRFPEMFQGQWWDRADMKMQFYEKVRRNLAVPYIVEAPITVYQDEPSPRSEDVGVTAETIVHEA